MKLWLISTCLNIVLLDREESVHGIIQTLFLFFFFWHVVSFSQVYIVSFNILVSTTNIIFSLVAELKISIPLLNLSQFTHLF